MLRRVLITVLVLGSASIATADVLPSPTRPEWDDTPIPMPSDPTELAAIALASVALFGLALAWRARRRLA